MVVVLAVVLTTVSGGEGGLEPVMRMLYSLYGVAVEHNADKDSYVNLASLIYHPIP